MRHDVIESLEVRRLLSFAPFGLDTTLPVPGEVRGVDVAFGADASSVVAAHVNNGNTESIVAVRYSSTGEQLGSPITVYSYTRPAIANGQPWGDPRVSVSAGPDGKAVVTFQVPAAVADPEGIYVARISSAGVAGTPRLIKAPREDLGGGSDTLISPEVSMDSLGGYFVGWIDYRYTTGEAIDVFSVYLQSFNQNDNPWAEPFYVGGASDDRGYPEDVQIAAYPDGTGAVFAYAMYNFDNDNSTDVVAYGRATTSAWLGEQPTTVNELGWSDAFFPTGDGQTVDDADEPSIAVYDDGSFVVGYRRYVTRQTMEDVSVQAAYAQRFNINGEAQGEPIKLATSLAGTGIRTGTHGVAIASSRDGSFSASFIQTIGDTDTLYARRFDAAGVADPTPPVAIATAPAQPLIDVGLNRVPRTAIAAIDGRASLAYIAGGVAHVRRLSSELGEIDNRVLYVMGDASDEAITIEFDSMNPGLFVRRGGKNWGFDPSQIDVLDVSTFGGNDSITNNTGLKATLRGGEGNDTIFGGNAEDRLHGGTGDDELWGRDGVDRIYGEDGFDSLYGNGSNDRLEGGAQPDHIRGNSGRDKLFGNGGNDRIYGGESGDWIYGQAGNDRIFGEGGKDRLYGDDGFIDSLSGGAGNDVFITVDNVIDYLFGDGGDDSANADDDDVLTSIGAAA
jgi:Ca2+-binding RTX toxin-like protein